MAALLACLVAVAQPGGAVPQAGKIAFRAERDGNAEIYVASPDGGNGQDLTNAPAAQDLDPAWSADGQWLAFARHTSPLGGTHILVMRAGGCCLRRLTNVPGSIDRQPAWSPDGTKIAFTRGSEDSGGFALWVMGGNGSYPHPLTGTTPHVFNGSPAWSPDGTKIAFVSDRGGGFPKVFVMNTGGTFQHKVSSGSWADGNPAWSPDGSLLAFDRCCPGGHSAIFLMPSTGGAARRVTSNAIEASNPTWSSDGTKLAFIGFPPGGGNRDIYTITTDGSGQAQVTNDPYSDLSPSWNPAISPTQSPGPGLPSPSLPPPVAAKQQPGGGGSARTTTRTAASPSRAEAKHRTRKHRKKKPPPPPITHRTTRVAPGLTLTRIVNRKVPLRTFILRAHVLTKPLTMDVALSNDELPGFETVRSMAGRHHAVAAVNGDFGIYSGRPMNIYAEDGDLEQTMFGWGNNFTVSKDETKEFLGHPIEHITASVGSTGERFDVQRINEGTRSVFGEITAYTKTGGSLFHPPANSCQARLAPRGPGHFDGSRRAVVRNFTVTRAGCFAKPLQRDGGVVLAGFPGDDQSLMIRALVPGQAVSLSWTLGWHEAVDTIGGFPRLLRNGQVVAQRCSSRFCGLNPRTGVGITSSGTILMVVVDGRRSRYSIGMTLVGFAKMMKRFGAVDALNLDGGGSSTMVVRGRVINNPSDPGGPRHVSSALLVLNGPDPGEPSFEPEASQTTVTPIGPGARFHRLLPRKLSLRAGRLAAMDPGSTGGLTAALASGAFHVRGLRLTPALTAMLRIYRSR